MKETQKKYKDFVCNKIFAKLQKPNGVYAGSISGDPRKELFNLDHFEIIMIENFYRDIIISGKVAKATDFLEKLSELLMLNHIAEGYFPIVKSVEFFLDDTPVDKIDTEIYEKIYIHFPTKLEYVRKELSLVSIFDLLFKLSPKSYASYKQIRKDLIIQINILYMSLSDNCIFPEVRIAFLIELFEAFVEYENLSKNKNNQLSLSISTFILYFGQEIFKTELENKLEFISRLVNTRVNVMHIKLLKSEKKNKLTKEQFIIYNLKLQLLYRVYLLKKIGIKVDLKNAITYAENPFDPVLNFDLKSSFKESVTYE